MHAIFANQADQDSAVAIPSFQKGYDGALQTVYDVLLSIDSVSDEQKVKALTASLKDYLGIKK
jgi:hypothetical protein